MNDRQSDENGENGSVRFICTVRNFNFLNSLHLKRATKKGGKGPVRSMDFSEKSDEKGETTPYA